MCFVFLVGLGYLIYLMCIVGCSYCCCLDLGWLVFAALWFVGWLLLLRGLLCCGFLGCVEGCLFGFG